MKLNLDVSSLMVNISQVNKDIIIHTKERGIDITDTVHI